MIQSYAAIYKDDSPVTKSNLSNRYVYEYLFNRYDDFDSITEVIYRIKNHLEERPICKLCGKRLKFKGTNRTEDVLFPTYCSEECRHNASMIHKAEVANKKEAERQSRLIEYGKPINDDVIKEMFLNGFDKKERLARLIVYANLKRNQISETYPVYMDVLEYLNNRFEDSASIQETLYRIEHGVEVKPKCPICGKPVEYVGKPSCIWRTYCSNKCKNVISNEQLIKGYKGLTKISKEEQRLLDIVRRVFPNTISQYTSEEYPFICDIYVPDIRLYIEYQGFIGHGEEPFEGRPEQWEYADMLEKRIDAKLKNSFTKKDPLKRYTAKKNNINFIEIWGEELRKRNEARLYEILLSMRGKSDDEIKEIIKKVSLHKTAYEIDYVPEESL